MQRATDEQKREYILNCLGATAQEVIYPELPTIHLWAQMRALKIAKFGVELSLEVKKDEFVHITFKPKETLVEFANRFYVKGQQLIISSQITITEIFSLLFCCAKGQLHAVFPLQVIESEHEKHERH